MGRIARRGSCHCYGRDPNPAPEIVLGPSAGARRLPASRVPAQTSLFSLMWKPIWLSAPLPPCAVCSQYWLLTLAAWNE